MCGRTTLLLNKDQVQCACIYKSKGNKCFTKPDWKDEYNDGKEYIPSYNIAPTDVTPVLVSSSKFSKCKSTERILVPMMWGMIPSWLKGDYRKHNMSTNNCRLENIKNSKLYYPALRDGGRCVVLVEGFYEWQTTENNGKLKQPYYIYAEQKDNIQVDDRNTWSNDFNERSGWKGIQLLHIAGLFSVWQNENTFIYNYSVITMDSNNTLDWLHHRMPAILETQEQIDAWLDIDNVSSDMALSYLKPAKLLKWHPVSTNVNNSRYKRDDCNKTISLIQNNSQKTLTSWFTKVQKRKSNTNEDSTIKKHKK